MSKIKRQVAKKDLGNEEIIDLTPEEAAAPAIGRKITVEKKVFSRPITIEESEAVEEDHTEDAFDDLDTLGADELSNDLLNFFDADSGDDGHRLRVFQMIKPSAGARFTKGGTIFRGEIPYTQTFLRDVQEMFGGGVFRLQVVGEQTNETTGRSKFGILKSRAVTIAAPPIPRASVDDPALQQLAQNGSYPQVPYFIQQPQTPVEQLPPKTTKEELREVFEIVTMVDKLRGNQEPTPIQPTPIIDPELAALQLIAKNPDVMEKLSAGIAKTLFGGKAIDDEPWWAGSLKEAISTGQLAPTAQAIIKGLFPNGLFGGLSNLFPGRQNNGQPPSTETQASETAVTAATTPPQHPSDSNALLGDGVSEVHSERASDGVPTPSPEEQALAIVLNNCARKVPVSITAGRVLGYADLLNEQAPQYSIDGYLEMFAKMPIEDALEFVKTQPNGEAIANLEWAKDYTEQLQKLIRESLQEGEE